MWDYKRALLDFLDFHNLYYVSNLGKGSYGRVFHVKNRNNKSFAAKFIPKETVNLHELENWKSFNHSNVLTLLDKDVSGHDTMIFIMDFMPMSLNDYLTNPGSLEEWSSFSASKRLLREILFGLNYLHDMKFCHLDLTPSNIFISANGTAKIGDFSGLTKAHEKRKVCPLPEKFWPPELISNSRKVWPMPIDLWAYGLLSTQTMIGHNFFVCILEDSGSNWNIWIKELKEKTLIRNFILRTYTASSISEDNINDFTDFALRFLELQPKKRLSAVKGLDHAFLQNCVP